MSELGHNKPIDMPDISSKAKAQEYVGLDVEKMEADKKEFLENVVPAWLEEAKERESKMNSGGGSD